jgi:tetratricopeptide (TPR) repeat protein
VDRGIAHAPDHAPLHYRRSVLLMARNDAVAALAAAESAVRFSPAAAYLREHLISLLLDLGRLDEAEAQLGAAVAKGIASAQLSYLESRLLEARGRAEEALALAQRAADQAPDKAYLHERVAALSLQAKRLDEADAAIAVAIGLAPDRAGPHYQRSRLLRMRGDLPGAVAAAAAAAAIEPGTGYIQDNLADAFLSSDRLDEAEAVIAAALDLGVRYGPLHFRRSLILLRTGNRKAALNEARLAADIAPQADYIRRHLERLLEEATPPGQGADDGAAVTEDR